MDWIVKIPSHSSCFNRVQLPLPAASRVVLETPAHGRYIVVLIKS